MKFLGSTKKEVDQDKHGEDMSKLESVKVVLVHCNLANSNYPQTSITIIHKHLKHYLLLHQTKKFVN